MKIAFVIVSLIGIFAFLMGSMTLLDAEAEVYVDNSLYDLTNLPEEAQKFGYKYWRKRWYRKKIAICFGMAICCGIIAWVLNVI